MSYWKISRSRRGSFVRPSETVGMIRPELLKKIDGRSTRERDTNPWQIRSYAELQEQMHRDLLAQNPDWMDADGNCTRCAEYDRRFAELISIFQAASLNSVKRAA